jgi:hypothetical protein
MNKPVLRPQVFHLCDTRSSGRLRSPLSRKSGGSGSGGEAVDQAGVLGTSGACAIVRVIRPFDAGRGAAASFSGPKYRLVIYANRRQTSRPVKLFHRPAWKGLLLPHLRGSKWGKWKFLPEAFRWWILRGPKFSTPYRYHVFQVFIQRQFEPHLLLFLPFPTPTTTLCLLHQLAYGFPRMGKLGIDESCLIRPSVS